MVEVEPDREAAGAKPGLPGSSVLRTGEPRHRNRFRNGVLVFSFLATIWSILIIVRSADSNRRATAQLLPILQESQTFEREILNARIAFIYCVTLNKPGSLATGWKRYGKAQRALGDLQQRINGDPTASVLKPQLDALGASWQAYHSRLQNTLQLVQDGQRSGHAYEEGVSEWAADGNALVNAGRNFADTAAALAQAQSDETGFLLRLTSLIVSLNGLLWLGLTIAIGSVRRRPLRRDTGAEPDGSTNGASLAGAQFSIPAGVQRLAQKLVPTGASWRTHLAVLLMLASIATVLGTGLFALHGIKSLTAIHDQGMASEQVLTDAESLRTATIGPESDTRAYVFSGRETLLVSQRDQMQRATQLLRRLQRETSADPQQQEAIREVSAALQRRFDSLRRLTVLRRRGGPEAVATLLANGTNLALKHDVEESITTFESAEYQRLVQGKVRTVRAATISRTLILFAAFPAALGLGLLGFITAHLFVRSTRLQMQLQNVNQTLNTLLTTAPVAIFSFVPGKRLGFWNPAAESIFRIRSGEVTETAVTGLKPELATLLDTLDKKLWPRLSGAALDPLVVPWAREGGEQATLSISAARVTHELGVRSEVVAIASDVTEQARLREKLIYQAHHDALTGLPNRLLLEERTREMLARARAEQGRCAIFGIDLDNFKHVNDRFGHETGDLFLKKVVERLSSVIRRKDTLGRVGGDEFLCLVESFQNDVDAEGIAAKLVASLTEPISVGRAIIQGSVSIGVAIYPTDGSDGEELRKNADAALYRAKAAGRSQYRRFALSDAEQRAELIQKCLQTALGDHCLHIAYQPQYSGSGERRGFEALLRLNHATLGTISPAEFVPIAEQDDLILQIGSWVLREACKTFAGWLQQGWTPGILSVNVSAVQFARSDFANTVVATLKETNFPPGCLELEITESMLMSDAEESARQMCLLDEAGIRLAIDDFGTGYSSLSHLNRFPIGTLKIDRSFVNQIHARNSSRPIIEAIVALADALSMDIVAEGVETEAQRLYLLQIGCDYFQGYLFARPLPAAEAEALLRATLPQPQHKLLPALATDTGLVM